MTNNRSVLLISAIALILLALVPAVSAYDYEQTFSESKVISGYSDTQATGSGHISAFSINVLKTNNIQSFQGLKSVVTIFKGNYENLPKSGISKSTSVIAKIGSDVIGKGTIGYNVNLNPDGSWKNTLYYIEFDEFNPGIYAGSQTVTLEWDSNIVPIPNSRLNGYQSQWGTPIGYSENFWDSYIVFTANYNNWLMDVYYMYNAKYDWSNTVGINQGDAYLDVTIIKNGGSDVEIIDTITGQTVYKNSTGENINTRVFSQNINVTITSPTKQIYYCLFPDSGTPGPGTPGPSGPSLRTGAVTMTDHNGTTIRGFDVRAVNYYTGEEYTASTDTDVATITLPMDRTISLRNPQTGQYEDVPVGYYLFYGYKDGYKMTNEEGVRISVMPEQYQGSYQLCNIIVTSEDGYLTGKHQFQIRSRADLRILQTGTISAQSATTGEWYNTTVVDGIATLILPYDTSDSISPYVGNYYVYATSPGYIPSEYATQISVRPDTQSEIRWILLTPIGGIPEAGNVTLRIQVISDSGQGIPNAQIHIDGVDGAGWEIWDTYYASSNGYAEISLPENSTYDITVYAQGYTDSSRRIEVGDTDPPLLEFRLYLSGWLTPAPTTQPTGWVTPPPTTQPSPGIPDEDDKSEGFLMEAIRGISKAFGVGFATGKTIFGMLLALAIGFATAKHLRGGAAEFGMGLLGGTMLGVLIGLLPVWVVVVLLLIVGMYVGYRYVGGSSNG